MRNLETDLLLLVEDNPDDIFLMQRALRKTGLNLPVQIVTDGRQAIDYLSGAKPYDDRQRFPLPSMVFLDLKLPYLNGFEVLAWIRAETTFRDLSVFVLTSSPEERDKEKATKLGARAYLVKPPTRASIMEVFEHLYVSETKSDVTPYSHEIRIY